LEQSRKNPSGKASAKIPLQGAGRAVIIGGPNSGKSKLLSVLTRATPEVADYPFTTREPQPGMMPWQDVAVQLIDTPPITTDVFEPVVQNLIRGADLVLLMLNLGSDDGGDELQAVLDRIGQTKTRLGTTTELDESDIGVTYTQTFLVLNKMDLPEAVDRLSFFEEFLKVPYRRFSISCETGQGLEELRDAIYGAMDVVRVYTKVPTKKDPDMDKPFTLSRGATLYELAELVHKDVAKNLKFAKIWGSNVHPGTMVKADYELQEKDIVEIHSS
jgi:hypothetical protein